MTNRYDTNMAGKTREIRGRIKAVSNIKRITRTMQMIATARFQASQRRASAAKPYTTKIAELVGELAKASAGQESSSMSHPLLHKPDPAVGKELLLVITSNRGLCGGYNGNILRTSTQYLNEAREAGRNVELQVVGRKGAAYFKFNKIDVAANHQQFGDSAKFEDVQDLAESYMNDFTAGKYDKVGVIYMAFETMSRQAPHVLQLLPLKDPTADADVTTSKAQVDYEYSPEPAELLAELLPVTVKTQLFQSFTEAEVSEQIARMIAMKAATDNATQMSKDLIRVYNRARQGAITTELTEVISGAMALG